ncbi:hypothetical protein M9Y10_016440 [Tritrichomonas musculus]|uniref:Protein kinase domain-containing protein n=1 Tax=Tritrichomonas musculus TaxID=1915356 RepID=A0ABR2HWC5_9EUKA
MDQRIEVLPEGTQVGSYILHGVLGAGAFSCVYKATKENETLPYALKVILKSTLSHEGDTERLQREIDTMAFLHHPNIVALHDFFSDEHNFYLVLDYCKGGDLAEYLIKNNGPLHEKQAANVFQQIVSAINYIHQNGVAHRDLKPQNILITVWPNIKISDFGLCGFMEDTKMKTFCGTPCYTAPECINQVQYNGSYSDVWSLGVILYEMVTGRHPWDVKNITKMIKQITQGQFSVPSTITPACDELIKMILKVRPNERPTCEKILNHPWMKLASSRSKMKIGSLPPLLRNSLGNITKTLDRKPLDGDLGVASPFNGNAIEKLNSTQPLNLNNANLANPAQRKFVRSSSGNFAKTSTISLSANAQKRNTISSTRQLMSRNFAHMQRRDSDSTTFVPQNRKTPPLPVPPGNKV